MSKMRTCNNKNVKLGFRLAQNIIGHEAEARDYLKKKVLLRNFGQTEKSSFAQRMFYGKSSFMMPLKYMRLGKWLWVRENGEITPKIISIC